MFIRHLHKNATTEFPAALFPWSTNWEVQIVCRMKETSIPAVETRNKGLRPAQSQSRPPTIAVIADQMFKPPFISSCSVLSVTIIHI